MADLTDRGQVLLVTGFVLAASFVALALVLNSVIYTENLATRGEEASGSDAVTYRADMVRGTGELVQYANHNNTTRSDVRGEYVTMMRSMRNQSARHRVVDARVTNTSVYAIAWGTRIGQDTDDDFTDVNGNADWKLVNETYGTRSFRINVTDYSLLATSLTSAFTVRVEDSDPSDDTDWTMTVYRDTGSGDTKIEMGGDTGSGVCTARTDDPTIDLTAGTIDGERCEDLVFGEGISPPYNITYQYSDMSKGNYTLVVNSTDYRSTNYQNHPNTPFAVDAIYASTIHVEYRTTDMTYETDARVVPGESDE